MFRHVIGEESNKIKNVVEKGIVKRFADSIGDFHPIYVNEETGRQSRYGRNIAPPTFPRVFDYGEIKGLQLPNKGLIHGEQIYYYERPLLVGEELYCYTKIKDYYEKEGKNGLMGFLVTKRYGEDSQGNVIFTEEATIIITEKVRKAMGV
ncbi:MULTISPECIES: MaoC family dehydratase N-terminal domain-containing protein [unclassified Oceanobacillus]|uniref:MaoC family dehydratase N-terminal domain-containing protein n=1 Tax=unclassified Oceanobacillus TaxID=2630292 RepID=UPI001BE52497|nr:MULTISPECIES: MaoC family dehydratase N-terminal domain-containing protein [unclassified Oceanobacillus]MBT2600649.1 MaoC family dehydratase N-terminal domain-containing protein [Oceanobacillus sp. ISL-74]MBT2650954.1 MaoC family dehydratase N-terminal domain-containing protein [Oceanobacillus sp. ISL-73]